MEPSSEPPAPESVTDWRPDENQKSKIKNQKSDVFFPVAALIIVLAAAVLRIDGEGRVVLPFCGVALPQVCTFHRLTGLPCPSCGLTRSFVATAHLDLPGALAHNPAGPFLFAFVLAQIPARLIALRRPQAVRLLGHRLIRVTFWAVIGLMLLWWVRQIAALR